MLIFLEKCLTYFIEKVEQNVHSLEVVFNLIKHIKLPEKFLTCYIFEWFKSCQKLSNVNLHIFYQDYRKLTNFI